MKKHLLGLGLALGVASFLAVGDASAKDMAGWKVQGSGSGIVDGQKYSLQNLGTGSFLGYQDRTGANFGWDGTANSGMKIARKSGGTSPLKCGEVFALFIEKEWMIYGKQTFGINLTSRTQLNNDDYYQWKFSCPEGQTVQLNQNVVLVNLKTNDSLVQCTRALGVNMCWADDVATVRGKNYRKADVPR
jgi:hypothetical protein